jgi:hypothetical protein
VTCDPIRIQKIEHDPTLLASAPAFAQTTPEIWCILDGNGLHLAKRVAANGLIDGFYFKQPELNGWNVGISSLHQAPTGLMVDLYAERGSGGDYQKVSSPYLLVFSGYGPAEMRFRLDGLDAVLKCGNVED